MNAFTTSSPTEGLSLIFSVKDKGSMVGVDWCDFPSLKDYNVLSQLKMVVRVFALLHYAYFM